MNKCPKCGGGRTHEEIGVSFGHCKSTWGKPWNAGGVKVFYQSDRCRISELEAQLASAKQLTADRIEDAFREAVELTDEAWKANDGVDVEGMWRHSEERRALQ